MSDLSIYFDPSTDTFPGGQEGKVRLSDQTYFHRKGDFPDIESNHIAVFGVCEKRGSALQSDSDQAPDIVRRYLYELYAGDADVRIVDLGNIKPGETVEDTYFAVRNTVEILVKNDVLPIILGGTQDLTFANYQGFEKLERTVNMLCIDPRFDLGNVDGNLNDQSYLGNIILHQPNYLFNFSNIGYQRYFVDSSLITLMDSLYFDTFRLGDIREDVKYSEPVIRNADIVSIDMAAVRMSDAPGAINSSPHGFYGEEMCRMCRYAGMADKLSSLGIYNYDPSKDRADQTAQLVAQMVWHFVDGFTARKNDFPVGHKEDYIRYRVSLKEHEHELVFLKSPRSDRWWVEVPYPPDERLKFERHCLVPCRYEDYEQALKDDLPDVWWKTYKKLG